ncbi:MAG: hypothetical protein HN855_14990 [Anaerolineae bacterium]|jgi:hypothetical protein|nr:hypothetical protein [Anaerolineae bacterium]MBT7326460.1 hypothetical protein [Anaerolineae bacterium]
MKSKQVTASSKKLAKAFLYLILIIFCCLPISYLHIYRVADNFICSFIVGNRINTEPNRDAIEEYILETLEPGMSRENVHAKLDEINIFITFRLNKEKYPDRFDEEIRIKMCVHPVNDIVLFIQYDKNYELITITIDHWN